MAAPAQRLTEREWSIVLLIAGVQFVNILDFVMVMPLGTMLSKPLGFSEDQLGLVGASYTGAACVAGLLASFFIDRFDRRKALAVAMGGLVLGTLSGGFAIDKTTLLLTRVIAGAFGGPATSISFAIISDTIAPSLRGRAMGTVMGAFSLAAVVGVPTGLFLAELLSWRAPFFATAGIGLMLVVLVIALLPPLTKHLEGGPTHHVGTTGELLSNPLVWISYVMTATVMFAGFILIPNIAAYMTLNLSVPLSWLKWSYLFGGVGSLIATQIGGRLVDRFGSFWVGAVGTGMVILVVYGAFYTPLEAPGAVLVFSVYAGFMIANGLRNVSYNTLASKVPGPEVRARFQSLQSMVQHGSSALAAYTSSALLTKGALPGTSREVLLGMPTVALTCMSLSLLIPGFLWVVESRVKASRPLVPVAT